MKKIVGYGFVVLAILIIVLLNIFKDYKKPADYPDGIEYATAKVIQIPEESMGEDPDYPYITIGTQSLLLEIESGQYQGKQIICRNYIQRILHKPAQIGTRFVVASYDGFITAMLMNYERSGFIYTFVALFLIVILIFGKMKGMKSIFSLAFTLICVFFLFIPLLLQGMDPILAALIVTGLSTVVTMVAINGFRVKSMLASVCCILCCAAAGLLAYIMGRLTDITTLNTAEAENLLFITDRTGLNISNLLVAGILIAAMGAIMDTCMSMVSSMYELKLQNPRMTRKMLFTSGFSIGRDIMGTMTNTLILAFAGGSINTVLVYYMYQTDYLILINSDLIIIEIIKGLSGSIAVILSIPVTVVLTAYTLTYRKESITV